MGDAGQYQTAGWHGNTCPAGTRRRTATRLYLDAARQFPPSVLSRPLSKQPPSTLVYRSHALQARQFPSLPLPNQPAPRSPRPLPSPPFDSQDPSNACQSIRPALPRPASVTPAPSGRPGTSIRQTLEPPPLSFSETNRTTFFPNNTDISVIPREPCPSVVLGPASPATGPVLHHRRRWRLYPSYRYATMASIRCTSVLKLRSFTCWLFDASIASGSVSTHSFAGTSADSFVYARMLNTVGSSITGRNVTVDTICFRIFLISAWISLSGLAGALGRNVVKVEGSVLSRRTILSSRQVVQQD